MATPDDVRVRLSAEGEAQVIAALRRVTAESRKSGAEMSRSFGGVTSGLASMKGLLVQLAAAVSVGALVAFTKQATDAADGLGKMAQSVGTTVKHLSALRVAALTANVEMGNLRAALVKFNRFATDALAGNDKAAASFKAIGISLDSIKGKDAAERFSLVAEALAKMKDSPEKTALAFEFFGRQAGALIPLLNDVGEVGLAGIIAKAEELNIVFTEDTARAAQAVNDDFTILKAQAESVAAQFVEGLAPSIHAALGFMQDDMAKSGRGAKSFGAIVGRSIGEAVLLAAHAVDSLVTGLRQMGVVLAAVFGMLSKGVGGLPNLMNVTRDLAKLQSEFETRWNERDDRLAAMKSATIESLPALKAGTQDEDAPIVLQPKKGPRAKAEKKVKSAEELASEAAFIAFQQEQNALDHEAAKINAEINAGVLSQLDGQKQLLALDRERLPALRRLAEAALVAAEALGDPAAIERARELGRTVELMAIQVESAGMLLARLAATVKDTLVSALTSFFTTGIREAKNFGEAVLGLASTVIDAVQQILASELAAEAVRAAYAAARNFGKFFGFAAGGLVAQKADGGYISGSGSGTSDSIPAMLSNGEFVVRAAVVREPGMLEALAEINRGSNTPALSGFTRARRYADGGLVSGAGNSRHSSELTIGLEPGLVLSELRTPEGEREVVRVLRKNRRSAGL